MKRTAVDSKSGNVKRRAGQRWPKIYKKIHRSGQVGYGIYLGLINGKRERRTFQSKVEAETFGEMARVKKQNEGTAAFGISESVRVDASKASAMLAPHGVSLVEAARYYIDHVLAYRNAPPLSEIVTNLIDEATRNERRQRTVEDLRYRLDTFAVDFPDRKLSDLTVEDLKDWLDEDGWSPRTRINFVTKISQLYNYAIKHGWADMNLAERIDRPSVEDKEPEILTIAQARSLLEQSRQFGLLPYVALGLFAGLRSAELLRLNADAVKLDERVIVIGQAVAKKRSRRVVEMSDGLNAWLQLCPPLVGSVVAVAAFRDNFEALKQAAGLENWLHNALRHSFGSYHLARHGDATKTANQMGHKSTDVVHNHYKALVTKTEAEKFWALRPVSRTAPTLGAHES